MAKEEQDFKDINLICKDCGKPFIFSAGDQQFYVKQSFVNAPTRCKQCRAKYQENKYKGVEIFNISCRSCDKVGKLPVKPTHPKEVLCEDCFLAEIEKERAKYGSLPQTLYQAMERLGKVKPS